MNSRRFLSEAARAAALVRVFALLVAMVSFCEAAAPRASAVVAVAIAVDELLQENTPALPDTLDDEDPQPAEPEPTARVCPCGCGKEHCGCSKSKSDEPIKEATDTRKVVRMWSPLWCGCCRTEERWIRDEGGKPDGDAEVRVEVIHEEKEGVTGYPHFEGPSGNVLTGLHHGLVRNSVSGRNC